MTWFWFMGSAAFAICLGRLFWQISERLKGMDGWRERSPGRSTWTYFSPRAQTFYYAILFDVLSGTLARSPDAGIRRDARLFRVIGCAAVLFFLFWLRWGS